MRRRFTCLIALLLIASSPIAQADQPAREAPADDSFDTQTWELTPYLKGTAAKIRDLLNSEVERLTARIDATRKGQKDIERDMRADVKAAVEDAKKSPAYRAALAEKTQAEQDLAAARSAGATHDQIDASGRLNRSRQTLEKLEKDAITGSKALQDDRNHLYDLQREQRRYTDALDKANKWRAELVEAIRNGFAMHGPVNEGSRGVLPKCRVLKVLDERRVLVEYPAAELLKQGKDEEGIKSYSAFITRVRVTVTGVETHDLKPDQEINFDRVFTIASKEKDDAGRPAFTAKPTPTQTDRLLQTLFTLHAADPEAATQPTPP